MAPGLGCERNVHRLLAQKTDRLIRKLRGSGLPGRGALPYRHEHFIVPRADLTDRQWLWCAGGFYLAGFPRVGSRTLLKGVRPPGIAVYFLIAAGYAIQNLGLGLRGRAVGGCPLGNTFEFFQFTAPVGSFPCLMVVGVLPLEPFGYFTSALAAALTLVSLTCIGLGCDGRRTCLAETPWIRIHESACDLRYGVFALLFDIRPVPPAAVLPSSPTNRRMVFVPAFDHRFGPHWAQAPYFPESSSPGRSRGRLRVLDQDALSVGLPKLLFHDRSLGRLRPALRPSPQGRTGHRRFAWTCLILFAGALLSLDPVNASRHPAAPVAQTP